MHNNTESTNWIVETSGLADSNIRHDFVLFEEATEYAVALAAALKSQHLSAVVSIFPVDSTEAIWSTTVE